VQIEAPPQAVFKALTDPDDLMDWFAESAEVSLDDQRYEFWGRYTPQGDRPRQQLVAADEDLSLRYRWEFDGGQETTVDLAIEDSSTVTMQHQGSLVPGLECFWYVSLANLAAYAEGVQTMPPFDFSVPAQGDALVRTVIDAPIEEVFSALLDEGQVAKWAGSPASISPSVGGAYTFSTPDGGPTSIVELEPDKVLAFTWHHPTGPETTVRWSLRSSRGSTYLTLVQTGFTDDALAEQFRQRWPSRLVELKRILEQGERWQPMAF
jgi:uncharacterized protein YndB with AHSA1/START domain